jgi:hypothetical protein
MFELLQRVLCAAVIRLDGQHAACKPCGQTQSHAGCDPCQPAVNSDVIALGTAAVQQQVQLGVSWVFTSGLPQFGPGRLRTDPDSIKSGRPLPCWRPAPNCTRPALHKGKPGSSAKGICSLRAPHRQGLGQMQRQVDKAEFQIGNALRSARCRRSHPLCARRISFRRSAKILAGRCGHSAGR